MSNYRVSLLLLVLCVFQAHASGDRALFWKIEAPAASVYLLGSIHYADEGFYPLREEIEQAFDDSASLVVELDLDATSEQHNAELFSRLGHYAGNETIEDHVSRKTFELLRSRLQQLGLPYRQVEKQKPGLLVLTLTAAHAVQLGLDPALGIDLHFMQQARGNKNIISLETLEQQLSIFLDIDDGELLLQETLSTMDRDQGLMQEMVEIWKQGDEGRLHELMFERLVAEYPAFSSIYEALFYRRNRRMAAAIVELLGRPGKYFVVVGAGHLVGEQGILRLLENAGYPGLRQ